MVHLKRIEIQVGDGLPEPQKKKRLPKALPEVNIRITKKQIKAKTRKLKMRWSASALRDLQGCGDEPTKQSATHQLKLRRRRMLYKKRKQGKK